MKIAYLVTKSNHGGAQVHLLELIRPLRRQHDIVVYTGESGYLTDELDKVNVRWKRVSELVHPIHPLRDVSAVKALVRLLLDEKPDLLHAHTAKAGLVGRLAARACHIPSVYTPHGWTFSERSSLLRRAVSWPVEWFCRSLNSHVIAVSKWERELGTKAHVVNRKSIETIPHGISDSSHRREHGSITNPVRVVMVGRFERPKDQLSLLLAFSQRDLNFPAELLFVGDGPTLSAVRHAARKLSLTSVHFAGDRSDVDAVLSEADILVLASGSECFGLCLVEAMRAGLPVIASRVGAVPEVVVEGETGLLYSKGNVKELACHLNTLIRSGGVRTRMGKRGRRRYERLFTAQRMVERTELLYFSVNPNVAQPVVAAASRLRDRQHENGMPLQVAD